MEVTMSGGPVLLPPVYQVRSPPSSQSWPGAGRGWGEGPVVPLVVTEPMQREGTACRGVFPAGQAAAQLSLWSSLQWALEGAPTPYWTPACGSFRKALSKDVSKERKVLVWRPTLGTRGGAEAISGRVTA